MTILDVNGKVITERPDYSKGRLVQGGSSDVLIYKTWDECPDTDEEGNEINYNAVSESEQRLRDIEDAMAELAELLAEV